MQRWLSSIWRIIVLIGTLSTLVLIGMSSNRTLWSNNIFVSTQADRGNHPPSKISRLTALLHSDTDQSGISGGRNSIATAPSWILLNTTATHKNKPSVREGALNITQFGMNVYTHFHESNHTPVTWVPRILISVFSNIYHSKDFNQSSLTEVVRHPMDLPYSKCSSLYHESTSTSYVFSKVYGKCDGYATSEISLLLQLDRQQTDYMDKLSEVALNWRGPISTVIFYQSLNASKTPSREYFAKDVGQIFKQHDVLGSTFCVHILYITRKLNIFPINLLRNIGMQFAPTDSVLLSEADFIPQPALDVIIRKHVTLDMLKLKRLYVVPIFGTNSFNYTIPATKRKLLSQWDAGLTVPITVIKKKFPFGHLPVNYKHYRTAEETYKVNFKNSFEPYYVVNRSMVPYYPEEFYWGFKDKYIHASMLHQLGWEFYVIPDGFMVHTPHSTQARTRSSYWSSCTAAITTYLQRATAAMRISQTATTNG